jgi:hypothetical protein
MMHIQNTSNTAIIGVRRKKARGKDERTYVKQLATASFSYGGTDREERTGETNRIEIINIIIKI